MTDSLSIAVHAFDFHNSLTFIKKIVKIWGEINILKYVSVIINF